MKRPKGTTSVIGTQGNAALHAAETPTYLSSDVVVPSMTHHQTMTTASMKRVYSNAHGYHINCFPEHDHEVLTRHGFMTLQQVQQHFQQQQTLELACPLADGSLAFRPVTSSSLLYSDVACHKHISMKHTESDIQLQPTTNHTMYVRLHTQKDDPSQQQWTRVTAGELSNAGAHMYAQMSTSCPRGVASQKRQILLPCCQQLGLATVQQAEAFMYIYGCWLASSQSSPSSSSLSFTVPSSQISLIEQHCQSLFASHTSHSYSRTDSEHTSTFSIHSATWLSYFSTASSNRLFSWILTDCSTSMLRALLEGMSSSSNCITVSSTQLRDDIMLACLQAGYSAHFTSALLSTSSYTVHFTADELTLPSLSCSSDMVTTNISGRVWCMQAPTDEHLLIFRRVLKRDALDGAVLAASRPTVVGNSISINSDGETFISADDLRINLWNIHIANETFNVVDVKPANLEELTEVITSATFHPSQCNTLLYSSSRGTLRLIDLRESALCDHNAKTFEIEEDPAQKSFFSEIISSISDAQFIGDDGRYVISRDYLTLKIWDVNKESTPIAVVPVHEYLRVHLCDLYENDCIFDKFEVAASSDGTSVTRHTHSRMLHVALCVNWLLTHAVLMMCICIV